MVDYSEIIFVLTKISLALTFATGIGIFVFAILRTRTTAAGHALILLSIGISGWSAALFANLWLSLPIIEESIYALSILVPSALAWLAYTFPNSRNKNIALPIIAPALFFALLSYIPGFIFRDFALHPEGHTETAGEIGYYIYHTLFFAYLAIAIIKINTRRMQTKNATLRQQFAFLAFGIFVFALLLLSANIILAGFYDFNYLIVLAPTCALFSALISASVITQYYYIDLKYILYDIIGKISLFLLAGLTYLFSLLVIESLARGHNILTYHIAFIITLLTSLKLSPIINREAIALAAGPKEKMHQEMVQNYIVDLFKQQHTAAEIANITAQLCADILNVKKCRLFALTSSNERELVLLEKIQTGDPSLLEEPTILLLETSSTHEIGTQTAREKIGEELRNIYDAAMVVTLSSHRTLYGLLIFSERNDGRGYSKQDIQLIQNILLPLSSALAEATFRAKIALLTTSGSNEAGKLREQIFLRDTRSNDALMTLRAVAHDALHILRRKLEAVRTFGSGAIDATEEALEKASQNIEHQVTTLEEEHTRPTMGHIDLTPLIHKLIETYGGRALSGQSHFSYEIPGILPTIGDYQQIFEALSLIFQDVFSEDGDMNGYISFTITFDTNTIKMLLSQKYNDDKATGGEEGRAKRQKCLSAYNNAFARTLIERNGGTIRLQSATGTEVHALITFVRDTSEDRGGVINT